MTSFQSLRRAVAAMLCVAVITHFTADTTASPPVTPVTPLISAPTAAPPTADEARQHQQAGRFDEAAAAWKHIVDEEPDNSTAWFNLGYCLHAAGQLDEAIEVHTKAATFDDYRGIALYNLACAYALTGEPEKALEVLRAAQAVGFGLRGQADGDSDLASLHDDPRFHALLANEQGGGIEAKIHQILGQVQQVIQQQAPQIQQKLAMFAQQAMGQAMNALGQLQQKLAQDPNLAPIAQKIQQFIGKAAGGASHAAGGDQSGQLLQHAAQLQAQGKFLEAAEAYHVVVQQNPDQAAAWFNLGYCLHAAGKLDDAIKVHQKAATFDDFRGIALYNLACAYSLSEQLEESLEALHAAHKAGFELGSNIATDPDLENLRKDPRFTQLLADLNIEI